MGFDDKTIAEVWKKGKVAGTNDATVWRMDDCGAWIKRDQYGNRNSQYGWEIDHITSKDHGGTDELSNLRPLQWENNVSKSAGRLKCAKIANGKDNVDVK